MRAIWNGKVIAESNRTINIEGNQYFPIESVNKDFLVENETHTVCPWKGTASYYNVVVCLFRRYPATYSDDTLPVNFRFQLQIYSFF